MADWYFRNKPSGGNQHNRLKICPGCRNLVNANEEFCPFCARRLRDGTGVAAVIRKFFQRPDSMTRFLIGFLVLVFLLQMILNLFLPPDYHMGGAGGFMSFLAVDGMTYIRMGSNFHALVANSHEYWRLLTYSFLHFGLIHIGFNCWAFWDLGRLVEQMWGRRQLFTTFILTGLSGGFVSFAWNALVLGSPKNSVGASGAICGVLGIMLGSYFKNRHHVGERLGSHLVQWAVTILVFGLIAGADNAAHIGGFLGGGALGYFLVPPNTSRNYERDRVLWNRLFWLAVVLLAVSIGITFVYYLMGAEFAATDLSRALGLHG